MFSVIAALSLRIGCPDVPDAPLSVRLPKASPGRSKIKSSGSASNTSAAAAIFPMFFRADNAAPMTVP